MKTLISAFILFFFTSTMLFSQVSTAEKSVNNEKKFFPAKADPKTKGPNEKVFCFPFGAYSNVPTGPSYFYLSNPDSIYLIDSANTEIFAATWGNDTWYGADYSNMTLVNIDTATGAITTIGSMGVVMNGLAYDPVSDLLYGVSSTGLYSIDTLTGTVTLIGEANVASSTFINLACSPSGKLYSVNMNDDILYSMDKTTGAATAIGSGIGLALSYAQDMEYDYNNNTLYLAAYIGSGAGGLYVVDTLTGTVSTCLGGFNNAEVCGMAIPLYTISTYSVDFSVLNGHGSLSATVNGLTISSGDFITEGDSVEFIAIPDSGYVVKEWIYNSAFISGNTTNNFSIDGLIENAVVTVEFVSTAGLTDFDKNEFLVFPNPAIDFISINVEENCVMNLWTAAGSLVISKVLQPGNQSLNVSDLPEGVYYITLTGDDIKRATFVVE